MSTICHVGNRNGQTPVLQHVPDKGEEALPSFALAYMDVDTVDYVLLPDVRVGYGSNVNTEGTREWHEQELNP